MKRNIPKSVRHIHKHYEPRHFESLESWQAYAKWLRRHARVALGMLPEPKRTPLKAKVFGRWVGDGYTCEKVSFESIPEFFVTGNLFRPTDAPKGKRKLAGILCPHGHWADGRLQDRDPIGSVIARCIQLARMGAVVFSYDMVGMNDSCQLPHRECGSDPHWGLSLMGLQTWNSTRALDFLLTMPEVDPKRIGMTGTSGGGTQTFTMMAVDERLAVAAPICMISYHMQGGCLCENAPLLRTDATSVDLARLFAPKPVFMGSCTGDWTKLTTTEELPAMKEVYRLFKSDKNVANCHVDDQHNCNLEMREAIYGWFNKALFGGKSSKPIKEDIYADRPPHRDRMVWWGRENPHTIPFATFRRMWRLHVEAAIRPHLRTAAVARKDLGPLLAHTVGVTLSSVSEAASAKPLGVNIEVDGDTAVISPKSGAPDYSDRVDYFTAYNRCLVGDRVTRFSGCSRLAPVGSGLSVRGRRIVVSACGRTFEEGENLRRRPVRGLIRRATHPGGEDSMCLLFGR